MTSQQAADRAFEPLSGMDAGFLYMETPTLHMHTLKVAVMRTKGGGPPLGFDEFRRTFERRIERLPSFRRRVMMVPLGLTHPVWITDREFDLARHVSVRRAPAPGGMAELDAIVGEVASRPLRRDRPLWEIVMVEGLEGGRVAFVCKLHHAMADGAAAMAMLLTAAARLRPEASDAAKTTDTPIATKPPTQWAVRGWALGQVVKRALSLFRLVGETFRGLSNLRRRKASAPPVELPGHFAGPRTRFNGALTERRSFATIKLPLADMKRAKSALGVTLNDVFLAVCGGALRAYLADEEGGVPAESLVASVPVNTDPGATRRTVGNRVGHLSVSLCTHVADPAERARTIHAMTDEAKQRQLALGPDLLERWIEYTPPEPYMAFSRFWSGRHMADRMPPPVNLVVSNVPGPREAITIGPYELESFYSVGPILEGIGLNLTGWSYGDDVCLVGLACPDQLEDVQALVDRIPAALAELLDACGAGEGDGQIDAASAMPSATSESDASGSTEASAPEAGHTAQRGGAGEAPA